MSVLPSIWFLLVTFTTVILAGSILGALWPTLRKASRWTQTFLFLLIAGSAILLLRPHEDTFTGLDTSCYRLMARAFTGGRGFHDVDKTLLSLPPGQRRSVLLEYEHWGRDTRDRSFEMPDINTAETKPYFYPFLPLAASGLETTTHWISGDTFAPFMGFLFFVAILCTGAARGNLPGLLAVAALLVGTPLPAYLMRGYYAEAIGAELVALVLLGRSLSLQTRGFKIVAPILLGFGMCFHPATIILSFPALAILLFDPTLTRRGIVLTLAGFAVGLAPFVLATLWVCQPYGDIANWKVIRHNLSVDAVHRLVAVFIVLSGIVFGWGLFGPRRLKARIITACSALLDNPAVFDFVLLFALLPFAAMTTLMPDKALVWTGLHEYWDGIGLGYGLILVIGLIAAFYPTNPTISRAILVLAVLVAPLFFYLKGFEQMGLWSQRRLLPLTLLLIVSLAPALASFCGQTLRRHHRLWTILTVVAVVGLALINPIRWPAPYVVRHEHGASQWVSTVADKLDSHFTFFDYHPYSVPFALLSHTRAVGLSEYGQSAFPGLAHWLASLAKQEPVLWVTAYSNPGLEDGVVLKERSRETITLKQVVSKTALPAEARDRVIEMRILEVRPITNQTSLSAHKILDDGPLAIRGTWGCGSPIRVGTDLLPSRWSREGSGIVGPVPPPGQSIRISIAAAASRDDGLNGQLLKILPPWGGPMLELAVSNDFTRVCGVMARPVMEDSCRGVAGRRPRAPTSGAPTPAPVTGPLEGSSTGVFRIYAETPYNPGKAGIRGYPPDLGARIHSITIEMISP